jgi:hypothetical protein
MRLLQDERLYHDTAYCLSWLRRLEVAPVASDKEPLRCHIYWSGALTRKVAFAIKSFLATQDLDRTELWLWLEDERAYDSLADNPLVQSLLPFVTSRRFDLAPLLKDIPGDARAAFASAANPAARSDIFRVLVLFHHGGLYADMDTMFLRDLHALPEDIPEFCYRWSATLPYATHAISRLQKGSEAALAIARRSIEVGSWLPWKALTFEGSEHIDICVLPCVFFDPLWPHHDRLDHFADAPFAAFDDFFREFGLRFRRRRSICSYRDFFPGAFAYQWHNRWDAPESQSSYFGVFGSEFDEILFDRLRVEPQPL